MKIGEIVGVTLNTGILAIVYTVIGGILSYLLYFFVDEHDEDWEKRSTFYQIGDVSLQLAVIGTIAFWTTYIMRIAPPMFPVSKELDELVDTYTSGLFFAYALFLFVDYLDSKVKFIYHKLVGTQLETMFPLRKTKPNKAKQ